MIDACVIGYGIIGQATAEVLGITKHFDRNSEKCNITLEEASKCRLIFICLPTPVNEHGEYYLDDITAIARQITEYNNGGILVIRSTVFPGFAMHLQKELGINSVLSNPEFLSEKTALQDMKNPPFILIGGLEGQYRDILAAYYNAKIKGSEVIATDNTTAEMTKLAMNTYFATKVIFANQLYDACHGPIGANYETVKRVMEKHPFGPKNHFTVWYNGKRGVNGHCLPKDTRAFANYTGSSLAKLIDLMNTDYIYLKENE
jgi:UDPglucose 6-dehydrogenase